MDVSKIHDGGLQNNVIFPKLLQKVQTDCWKIKIHGIYNAKKNCMKIGMANEDPVRTLCDCFDFYPSLSFANVLDLD